MEQPKRQKPRRVMGMSDGKGKLDPTASSGMNRTDWLQLRLKPSQEPSRWTIWNAAARSSREPTRVPSSSYQAFKARPGTSALMCSTRSSRTPSKLKWRRCGDRSPQT